MSDTATLLSTLRERGVKLWVDKGSLKCSAPVGALDPELRAKLAERKQEILAFLAQAEALKNLPPALVPIKPAGSRPAIFAVSGYGGDPFYFVRFSRHLDPEQPLFGVQPPGLDGSEPLRTMEALARYQIEQIRQYQARGPYFLAGHCSGGALAFEIAQQLTAAGERVELVALFGSPFPTAFRRGPQTLFWLRRHAEALRSGSPAERMRYVATKLARRLRLVPPEPRSLVEKYSLRAQDNPSLLVVSPASLEARERVQKATLEACRAYRPRPYPGRVDLFISAEPWHWPHKWRGVLQNLREHDFATSPIEELLLGSDAATLAAVFQQSLDQITAHVGERPIKAETARQLPADAPRPESRGRAALAGPESAYGPAG